MPVVRARRGIRVGGVVRIRLFLPGFAGHLHLVTLPVHPVEVMADGSRPVLPALRVPFEEAVAKAARRL